MVNEEAKTVELDPLVNAEPTRPDFERNKRLVKASPLPHRVRQFIRRL